ncbi:MAG: hypothetical protein C4538_10180 [Nitrospiraceae bacterium]|nr:MAG: hypothetical protein C4538_10180 [Nitrospiraceae bacterium]
MFKVILLISKHLKFHLTSLHAQRAACCGISIIDKRHFTFLLQGISVYFKGKIILPIKFFLKRCRIEIPAQTSLCASVPSIGTELIMKNSGEGVIK